jgi:ribosomal subunit interface protein
MRINLKSTNIKLTDAITSYLDKRIGEIARVMGDQEKGHVARVELAKSTMHHKHGKVFYSEITLHVKRKDFRASAYGEDLYEAIDLMKSEILREIKRHHERKRVSVKSGGREMKRRVRGT